LRQRSRIQILVDSILPGLPPFDPKLSPAERTAQAIEANVRWTVKQIVETPEARARLAEGKVKIIGAPFRDLNRTREVSGVRKNLLRECLRDFKASRILNDLACHFY